MEDYHGTNIRMVAQDPAFQDFYDRVVPHHTIFALESNDAEVLHVGYTTRSLKDYLARQYSKSLQYKVMCYLRTEVTNVRILAQVHDYRDTTILLARYKKLLKPKYPKAKRRRRIH